MFGGSVTTFADLVGRVRGFTGARRALLGITGSPGAGKTTLVSALLEALRSNSPADLGTDRVAHVPMDGFHLADVELCRLGLAARKGAPETFDAGGYVALLRRLRADDPADDPVYAPAFERVLEQPLAGAIPVSHAVRLVLTEGNYLLLDGPWAGVRAELDEVWFCDLRADVRQSRLIARHVAFGKAPEQAGAWVADVDGPNAALVEATRDRADVVVPSSVLEELRPP